MQSITLKEINEENNVKVLQEIKERIKSIETDDKVYRKWIDMYTRFITRRIVYLLNNQQDGKI